MAGQEILVMTQADRDLIQRFLDEKRRGPAGPPPGRGREGQTEHEEWLTPEVYIAKISDTDTGIPALVGSEDEAVIGNDGDIPGYADCIIYQIIKNSAVPKLRKVSPATKRVYNIFGTAITDTPWIPVTRDKFGSWLAMGGSVTASVGTGGDAEPDCGFLILDCPGTGSDATVVGTGTEGDFIYLLECCDFDLTCMPANTPIPASLTATVVIRDSPGGTILATFSIPINYSDSINYNGLTRGGWYGCSVRDVDTECVPVATVFVQCVSSFWAITFNGYMISGHTACDGFVFTNGESNARNLVYNPSPFALDNYDTTFSGAFASPTCGTITVNVHISE